MDSSNARVENFHDLKTPPINLTTNLAFFKDIHKVIIKLITTLGGSGNPKNL